MLDLLIGIFMMTGTQFTQLDDGRVAITTDDATKLRETTPFQEEIDRGVAAEDIVITDSVDPSAASVDKE